MTGGTRDHKLNSTLKKNSAAPYYTPLHFCGEEKWIATTRNSGGETESTVSPLRFQRCSLFCLLRSPLFFRASVRPRLPHGRAPSYRCGNACFGTFVLRAIAVPVQRPEKVWRRSSVFTERRWGISWRGVVRIAVKSAVCIVSVAENKQAAARASSVTGLQFFFCFTPSDTQHTCSLCGGRKVFFLKQEEAEKEETAHLQNRWPRSSSSSSSVEIRRLSLQLCSHPAVKRILHKRFKRCKNKMWIRTISISWIQAHKYASWILKDTHALGKDGSRRIDSEIESCNGCCCHVAWCFRLMIKTNISASASGGENNYFIEEVGKKSVNRRFCLLTDFN